jgi:fructose-1-phosphate kinase PfkB-like protein
MKGLSPEEMAGYAAAFGTAKTLVEGTGTPSKETIDELYTKVVINDLK